MASPTGPIGQTGSATPAGFDRALIAVSAVVVVGAIMSILDVTIVNIAIESLAADFGVPLTTIQWVSTGYMLALATVIPLSGWAADRFGTKRLYMLAIACFVAGSALAGAAWSAESLICFRVLQGIGGGMLMPTAMTILTRESGPERLGRVMSVVGVPMLLGPVLGPVLGGWIVDDFSWRWIFYVNVPIGALALLMSQRILPADEHAHDERLDWLGLALLSPGLALFVYGLAEVSAAGGFDSPLVAVALFGGATLLGCFLRHSLRAAEPLVAVRLFRQRVMAAASSTTFIFGLAFFGVMFLVPLYLQIVHDLSAFHAGLLMAPQGIGAALMMPIAGRFTDRRGPGKVVLAGLVVLSFGLYLLSGLDATTPLWRVGANFFINGVGIGLAMMPAMSAAYQSLAREQIARATTALNIIQRIGGSIGVAILAVVLQHEITAKLGGFGVAPGSAGGSALEHAGEIPLQGRELLAGAFSDTFLVALGILVFAFIPAALLPRQRPVSGSTAGDAGAAPQDLDQVKASR